MTAYLDHFSDFREGFILGALALGFSFYLIALALEKMK